MLDTETQQGGGVQFIAVGRTRFRCTPWQDGIDVTRQHGGFFVTILHQLRNAEGNHGSIVHRVVKVRARQHQAIHQRHAHAQGNPAFAGFQQSTGDGTVQVQAFAFARIQHGNHERLPTAVGKGHMRNAGGIENGVDGCGIVMRTLGNALNLVACGLAHDPSGFALDAASMAARIGSSECHIRAFRWSQSCTSNWTGKAPAMRN